MHPTRRGVETPPPTGWYPEPRDKFQFAFLPMIDCFACICYNTPKGVFTVIYIGCHLSVTNGCLAMGETMLGFGGDTFAFFTRNPRGGKSREIDPADAAALSALLAREGFGPLVAHGSYTMNLCAANPSTLQNGLEMFADDMKRMAYFPGQYYNFHPGAHVGQGAEKGIELISAALDRFLTPDLPFTVLLETMAGKGSEVGGSFAQLRQVIDGVAHSEKLGVCLDTCHVWDAGYDIVNDLDGVLTEFDKTVGLSRLKAVHLNDSKNDLGSHKDRHEKLGQGRIGADALRRVVCHPALQGLPFVLETPNDDAGYIKEIALVKEWMAEA